MLLAAVIVAVPADAGSERLGGVDLRAVAVRGDRAVMVGDSGAVYFARLPSKGERFQSTPARQKVPTTVGINDVAIDARGQVWTAGVGGQFLLWDGRRWTAPAGSTGRTFHALALLGHSGIAVGKDRVVFRRAKEWLPSSRKTGVHWRDVTAATSRSAIAVGNDGRAAVIRRVPRGVRVFPEITGVKADLVRVTACPGGEAVAAARDGAVIKRTRRGRWSRLPVLPETAVSLVVRCRHGRVRGIIAAGGRALFRLRGASWQRQPVKGAIEIRDMASVDRHRILVVGARGFAAVVRLR